MENSIKRFKINKLHKIYDIALEFNENRLILVGENGTGKTTCLKMFYLVISGQIQRLSLYDFESISIEFQESDSIAINKKDLTNTINIDAFLMRKLPPPVRNRILHMSESGNIKIAELEQICSRYGIPMDLILSDIREFDLFNQEVHGKKGNQIKQVIKKLAHKSKGVKFIYLPTFRRIESDLRDIFNISDDDDFRRLNKRNRRYEREESAQCIELVEFGMEDIVRTINETLYNLIEDSRKGLNDLTLTYLGNIASKEYENLSDADIKDIDEQTITEIVNRADSHIMTEASKAQFLEVLKKKDSGTNFSEHEKIIFHYLLKLQTVNNDIKAKEVGLRKFAEVCNKYMINKRIEYNSANFSFKIETRNSEQEILLPQLSSGEKQIVSLFSYLYLSNKDERHFIIIDEPELSLSVDWQRSFLQDISDATNCAGFFAVTHSPFIFDNSLVQYAKGINVFTNQR